MQIDKLLSHHGLSLNPFVAEEARHDPVFEQLLEDAMPHHPDFAKNFEQRLQKKQTTHTSSTYHPPTIPAKPAQYHPPAQPLNQTTIGGPGFKGAPTMEGFSMEGFQLGGRG